jgi:hypothetical protein
VIDQPEASDGRERAEETARLKVRRNRSTIATLRWVADSSDDIAGFVGVEFDVLFGGSLRDEQCLTDRCIGAAHGQGGAATQNLSEWRHLAASVVTRR